MKKSQAILLTIILLTIPVIPSTSALHSDSPKVGNRIGKAVAYLVSHFNPKVGLIYESEDPGTHWLNRTEYPSYRWNYSSTYWLYSDNLFAEYALAPFAPDTSDKINQTIQRYHPPPSGKFEACFGQPVGPDRLARDVILATSRDFVVLLRLHDGPAGNPRIPYADSMIYRALSEYWLGHLDEARRIVKQVHDMWNGSLLVDYGVTQKILTRGNAPSDLGFGLNFKIALLLYASQITGANFSDFSQIEEYLWTMQNPDGGIASLSQNGKPLGSANCETTSLTLLIYNSVFISHLQQRETAVPEVHSLHIIAVLMVIPILTSKIKRCRK